jgi:PEP-CTERM motif
MGDLVAAVDRYPDIPVATRAKLQARMAARRYDEIVDIHRDRIVGRHAYGAEIRDMHFGNGQVCRSVSRGKWTAQTLERGLVYCEDGQCILVPTVCRNVSRITRTATMPGVGGSPSQARDEETSALAFDPPGAGAPMTEGGGAGTGEGVSFAQVAALPTPVASAESLIRSPSLGGAGTTVPGLISLPQVTSSGNGATPTTPDLPTVPTVPDLPAQPVFPAVPAVPEPQTWALFVLGLAALAVSACRRR